MNFKYCRSPVGELTITSIPQCTGTSRPALRGFSLPRGFFSCLPPPFCILFLGGTGMEHYALLRFSSPGGGVPHPEFPATVFRVCTVLRVLSWVSRDFLPLFEVLAQFCPPPPLPWCWCPCASFPDDFQIVVTQGCRAANSNILRWLYRVG